MLQARWNEKKQVIAKGKERGGRGALRRFESAGSCSRTVVGFLKVESGCSQSRAEDYCQVTHGEIQPVFTNTHESPSNTSKIPQ